MQEVYLKNFPANADWLELVRWAGGRLFGWLKPLRAAVRNFFLGKNHAYISPNETLLISYENDGRTVRQTRRRTHARLLPLRTTRTRVSKFQLEALIQSHAGNAANLANERSADFAFDLNLEFEAEAPKPKAERPRLEFPNVRTRRSSRVFRRETGLTALRESFEAAGRIEFPTKLRLPVWEPDRPDEVRWAWVSPQLLKDTKFTDQDLIFPTPEEIERFGGGPQTSEDLREIQLAA